MFLRCSCPTSIGSNLDSAILWKVSVGLQLINSELSIKIQLLKLWTLQKWNVDLLLANPTPSECRISWDNSRTIWTVRSDCVRSKCPQAVWKKVYQLFWSALLCALVSHKRGGWRNMKQKHGVHSSLYAIINADVNTEPEQAQQLQHSCACPNNQVCVCYNYWTYCPCVRLHPPWVSMILHSGTDQKQTGEKNEGGNVTP